MNLKPITRDGLINNGYNLPVLGYNALFLALNSLVGHGKEFDATPTKVAIKYNPEKPIPSNLIDNIKDYLECFPKGSSNIRKIFRNGQNKPCPL